MILSAGSDAKIKIWDVYGDRKVRRTYQGHHEGLKAIEFLTSNGTQFVSAAFDRFVRHWDTETGQIISTMTNRKMGYCLTRNPHDENIFLMGSSDNKVVQWDVRTGQVVQEYNYHLAPVNSVTFLENGRRLVSTADDKKLLIWEYDLPVPIRYLSEPTMHSVPVTRAHPSGQFFCGQSLNNTIVTYTAQGRVKYVPKKMLRGHNNTGYGCMIDFSPNGQYVISGDGHGRLFCWDWKTQKVFRRLQAHSGGPAICARWHPIEESMVATCGWDGLIKLWEA